MAGGLAPARGIEAEYAPVVLADKLVERRVVVVAEGLGGTVDRLGDHRRLDVLAPIAGGRGVGQEPGVELDGHRPPGLEQLGDLVGQRAPRLHLVDVDAEQVLEVARVGLEERPLIALEVEADQRAEDGQWLVAARVDELDQDVRVAVGLVIRPVTGMDRMRHVRRRIVPEQGDQAVGGRLHTGGRAHAGHSWARTSSGHVTGSSPCVRRSASVTRSCPNPRQAVCASPPSASRRPCIAAKWFWW